MWVVVLSTLLGSEVSSDAWLLGLARQDAWHWGHLIAMLLSILVKYYLFCRRIVQPALGIGYILKVLYVVGVATVVGYSLYAAFAGVDKEF